MKLSATATLIASILATTSASAVGEPVNTFDLNARSMKSMTGKCTGFEGGCKVPGGLHSAYDCWNSHCGAYDKDKDCVIAPGANGDWVAKCPQNDLPYDWAWPTQRRPRTERTE